MSNQVSDNQQVFPPQPRREEQVREFHGRRFADPYEWMRQKESPELLEHLQAENAYTEARTEHLKDLTEAVYQEVKARVQETDLSLPVRSGDFWYFSRSEEGKSYGATCRVPLRNKDDWTPPVIEPGVPAADEEVLLDSNVLAEGHEFFSLGAASVSYNGKFLAYSVDYEGDERFTLFIKDLETGELLDEPITDVFYGATWIGNDTVLYQRVDDAWRPHEIWEHKLGTAVAEDRLVFREEDERFWTSVSVTRSERFLLVYSGSKVTSEVWFRDLKDADSPLTCVLPREDNIEYGVDHAVVGGQDFWLVVHNATGPNSELGYHPVGVINSLSDATVLVAHSPDARVEGVDCFATHLVLEYRKDGVGTAELMMLDMEASGEAGFGEFQSFDFAEPLLSIGSSGNSEWESPVLRVVASSFVQPGRVFDIVLATGEKVLRKQAEVLPAPDGRPFAAEEYMATRLWVPARDGVRIPVSLIHRRDVDIHQANPVLLYGYGSYETSIDPSFSIFRLSMLDRGVVYAIAHVRGGGEMGRLWYDTGKGLQKKNTFFDFIDVADYLLDHGMTTREQLVAEGGSAGGMLMGAVANMAGDRFAGIQAVVPFVDSLTSMLMPELPLTIGEWDEWGDPYHDPEVYDYMASYSPYENIDSANVYPPILAITSINDTRVLYVEPAKWVAQLRHVAGADALLKCDLSGGHGGVSGRYEKWRQSAFETAWELDRMGAQELKVTGSAG